MSGGSVTATLYTIPISHYGERARWALDRSTVAYREVHHLQMFSWLYSFGLGRTKTLPVLTTTEGTFNDSVKIMAFADRHGAQLYPTDGTLDRELAGNYGVETRKLAYAWFFAAIDRLVHYNMGRAPPAEQAMLRATMPLAVKFLGRYLDVREETVRTARDTIMTTLDRIAARLADGRPFLDGDRFSAVDLTFAAMSAPVIAPRNYGIPLPSPDEFPEEGGVFVREVRAHPAGAYAMRLYAERPKIRAEYVR